MLRGERSAFKIAPELSFAEKGCQMKPPKGVSAEADLVIDMQVVHWYPKGQVRALGDNGVILRTLKSSESWEHPRAPFEVSLFGRSSSSQDVCFFPFKPTPPGETCKQDF